MSTMVSYPDDKPDLTTEYLPKHGIEYVYLCQIGLDYGYPIFYFSILG